MLFIDASDEAYGADRILLEPIDAALGEHRDVRVLLPDDVPPGRPSARLAERGVPVEHVALAIARRRYLKARNLPRYAPTSGARRIVRRRATAMHAG